MDTEHKKNIYIKINTMTNEIKMKHAVEIVQNNQSDLTRKQPHTRPRINS